MGYDKKHVPVLDAKEGYNKLAKTYQSYHKKLDRWDRGIYTRFLPRDLTGSLIADLGGGDGRAASKFVDRGVDRYVLVDIAQELLAEAPGRTETMVRDLREPWELGQEFDVMLAHFVLIHLPDLEHFFLEAADYLRPEGRLILVHHLERQPYLHTLPGSKFKIQSHYHRFTDVELAIEQAGLQYDYLDMETYGSGATKIYCCSR